MIAALLIPVDGPLQDLDLPGDQGERLSMLQALVDGLFENIYLAPKMFDGWDWTSCYVNEEYAIRPDLRPNMRATDYVVPGASIPWRTVIRGPMVLLGHDPWTGATLLAPPPAAIDRARLIEREAGDRPHDMAVRCDTCGTWTGMDTHCCGRCAEDSNDPDRDAGRRRISRRRTANGLPALDDGDGPAITTVTSREIAANDHNLTARHYIEGDPHR